MVAPHDGDLRPTRELHAICPFPPGNGADVVVRFYARQLQERLGQPVVVENRAGAFGNIATTAVARGTPDGYTIGIIAGSSQLAAAASLFRELPFDPVRDIDQITTLMKIPFLLIVSGDSPFTELADLTTHLREQGDSAFYGSATNTGLVASELYKDHFGLRTTEVKYADPIPMINDLMNGQLDFVHLDPVTVLAYLEDGRLRALATSAKDRFSTLPGIPSAADAGIGNSDLIAWWSAVAPAGMPDHVKGHLESAFNDIVQSDEHAAFVAQIGGEPFPGDSGSATELLIRDMAAWQGYVRLANIPIL